MPWCGLSMIMSKRRSEAFSVAKIGLSDDTFTGQVLLVG